MHILAFAHKGQAQHQAHLLLCRQARTKVTMPQHSRETRALGLDGLLRLAAVDAFPALSSDLSCCGGGCCGAGKVHEEMKVYEITARQNKRLCCIIGRITQKLPESMQKLRSSHGNYTDITQTLRMLSTNYAQITHKLRMSRTKLPQITQNYASYAEITPKIRKNTKNKIKQKIKKNE